VNLSRYSSDVVSPIPLQDSNNPSYTKKNRSIADNNNKIESDTERERPSKKGKKKNFGS
jgi:hypothetical protein